MITVEQAADCVKACNNACDDDYQNTPIELFSHFVEFFDWNPNERPHDSVILEVFAKMCGFPVAMMPDFPGQFDNHPQ